MLISVVIPAFDEEGYLGPTLASLHGAAASGSSTTCAWRGRYEEVPR